MNTPIDPVWGLKLTPEEVDKLRGAKPVEPTPTFKPLEEISPLDADDMACFSEIRQILERHKKLDRFGITLLHKHFDMGPQEILVETTDSKERTMNLEPKILDTSDITAVDTQWYLGTSMPLSLVKCRTKMHI